MIESVRLFKQPPPRPGCELPEAKVTSRTCVYSVLPICMLKCPTFYHRSTLTSKKATVMEFSTHLVGNIMPLVPC